MRSNKMKTILFITGFVLFTLLAIWSWREIEELEEVIIQEEYQMEVLEILDNIRLLAYPVGSLTREWEPRVEIAPGVEIFYDRLARYTHIIQSEGHQGSVSSMEDIISLYNSYDEELNQRLRNLWDWWGYGGDTSEWFYLRGIIEALDHYKEQHGAFNGKECYTEMRIEDMIALERYLRDNPNFLPDAILRSFF